MTDRELPPLIAKRYLPELEIGSGGMGTVYRARDLTSGERVAIKRIRPDVLRDSPDLLLRFVREGETLRRLNHPNIVKLLDTVQDGSQHYLVMEYVEHGDLRSLISEAGALSVTRTIAIAVELADALARAHHLKIIHRDLKPANVLIAADGTPRLTDFGVARLVAAGDVGSTGEGSALGTPAYMPPEALAGERVDASADLWALGIMLFEMLTGEHPFAAKTPTEMIGRVLTSAPDDLEQMRPDVPVGLVDLIYRLLTKDRMQRLSSARRVGALLEGVAAPQVEMAPAADPPTVRVVQTETPQSRSGVKQERVAPNNLPAQTSVCIGRTNEIASAQAALESSRLVTLVGMGGIGKTRLALEIATRLSRHARQDGQLTYPEGVYFVALAPLPNADAIVGALAEAIGQPFAADTRSPLQQVIDGLQAKTVLIVLDNFEHILDGASIVGQILEGAPSVRILATSRERLNLTSEFVVALSGIDVSDIRQAYENHGAVAIFMQAASRVNPSLEWDEGTLSAVASICRRVYGVPLALVLAAAWCDSLTPSEIDMELARSYELLEGDMRDLPPRQRSLRAVFEYSWALITLEQRETFVRLSVFRGGFTRDAALAVAGASLRLLSVLQSKSLIRRDPETARYDIHPLLTQFAQAELASQPAVQHDTEAALVAYFGKMETLVSHFSGKEQAVLTAIEAEYDNLRTALNIAVRHRNDPDAAIIAFGLTIYSMETSRFAEGVAVVETARGTSEAASSELKALLTLCEAILRYWYDESDLVKRLAQFATDHLEATAFAKYASIGRALQGFIAAHTGDYASARTLSERGWNEAREHDFIYGEFISALAVIETAIYGGALQLAIERTDQIIARMEAAGSPSFAMGQVYALRGHVHHQLAQLTEARTWYERSYSARLTGNNKLGLADSLVALGNSALALGEMVEARQYLEQSIAIYQEFGDRRDEAEALNRLGGVDYQISEFQESYRNHQEALRLYRQLNDPRGTADSLVLSAIAFEAIGDPHGCRPMLDEALAIRRELGNPFDIVDALINLGQMYFIFGQFDEARACFIESDRILAEHPDPYLDHFAHLGKSYCALFSGDPETSLDHIGQVIEYGYANNVMWMIAYGIIAQASSLALLGRMDEADQASKRLIGVAQAIGNRDLFGGALIIRSIVRAVNGDWERALSWAQFLLDRPQTSNMIRTMTQSMLKEIASGAPAGTIERAVGRAAKVTLDEIETVLMHDL